MIGKIANAITDAFRDQPVILAILVVNVIFLLLFSLVLREIADSIERRDAMIERCIIAK